MLHVTRNLW